MQASFAKGNTMNGKHSLKRENAITKAPETNGIEQIFDPTSKRTQHKPISETTNGFNRRKTSKNLFPELTIPQVMPKKQETPRKKSKSFINGFGSSPITPKIANYDEICDTQEIPPITLTKENLDKINIPKRPSSTEEQIIKLKEISDQYWTDRAKRERQKDSESTTDLESSSDEPPTKKQRLNEKTSNGTIR